MYYKFENRFGEGEPWMLYVKVIQSEWGEDSCRTFQFQTPVLDDCYSIDFNCNSWGNLNTNTWQYYEDMACYEEITKEEFENALKKFRVAMNKFLDLELEKQTTLNL